METFALSDLRIVDFTWVLSGPYATKMLADQGAQVIKIESASTVFAFYHTPDSAPQGQESLEELDRGPAADLLNRNKLSVTLNLKTARGLEIVKRLIRISDVVVENFSATGMEKLGLDYPAVREENPKIIMVSMAGFGHTGPYRNYISHGMTLQAMCGIDDITGYPDGAPMEPGVTFMDYAAGSHAAIAVLAALRHRNRTGEGQYIDLGQYDLGCSLAGLSLFDYTVNGRVQTRVGNRHHYASPHGCYRCRGEDRWCTLAVFTEEEWQKTCKVMEDPAWSSDPKFASPLGRLRNREELDRLIETWTSKHTPEDVMHLMQQNGVEAGVVQNIEDLITKDKHLESRGLYREVPHPTRFETIMEGIPYKASRTPGKITTACHFPGEHNEYICRDMLGMSGEEFEECRRNEVFS